MYELRATARPLIQVPKTRLVSTESGMLYQLIKLINYTHEHNPEILMRKLTAILALVLMLNIYICHLISLNVHIVFAIGVGVHNITININVNLCSIRNICVKQHNVCDMYRYTEQ